MSNNLHDPLVDIPAATRTVTFIPGSSNGRPAIAIHIDGEPRRLIIEDAACKAPRIVAEVVAASAARTMAHRWPDCRFAVAFSSISKRC